MPKVEIARLETELSVETCQKRQITRSGEGNARHSSHVTTLAARADAPMRHRRGREGKWMAGGIVRL